MSQGTGLLSPPQPGSAGTAASVPGGAPGRTLPLGLQQGSVNLLSRNPSHSPKLITGANQRCP